MLNNPFYKIINTKKFLYLSIVITFSIISFYIIDEGPNISSPDTILHLKWADSLIQLKFNLYNFYTQNPFVTPTYFYTIQIILVALAKFFFGSHWYYLLFGFNLLLVLLSIIIFSKSLLIVGVRPIIISLSVLIILISPDWMTFPSWILTDTTYSFLIIFTTYIIIKSIRREKFSYLILIFLLIIMVFTRPAFPPIILTIVTFIAIYKYKIYINPKLIFLFIFLFFLIIPLCFAGLHYIGKIYLSDINQINYWLKLTDKGIVVWKRYETYIEPPVNYTDHVYFYFLRLVSFFKPYAITFSKFHIIVNSFQLFYFTVSILIWSILGGKKNILDMTVIFILLLSFSVAAFHAFVLIDWDWRYRYPVILPLMMILPISIEILFRKYLKT